MVESAGVRGNIGVTRYDNLNESYCFIWFVDDEKGEIEPRTRLLITEFAAEQHRECVCRTFRKFPSILRLISQMTKSSLFFVCTRG